MFMSPIGTASVWSRTAAKASIDAIDRLSVTRGCCTESSKGSGGAVAAAPPDEDAPTALGCHRPARPRLSSRPLEARSSQPMAGSAVDKAEQHPGLAAGHAILCKALLLLEVPYRGLGIGSEDPVDPSRV
jgi:hypothetical protein